MEEKDPEDYHIEKEWADRLGIHFDPSSLPPPPAPQQPESEQSEFNQSEFNQPEPQGAPIQPQDMQPPGQPPFYSMPPLHPHGPMPPTYMIWAILATICCCMPAGIVAIVYSSMVSSKYYSRDYEGARRASERAEIWIIAAIVTGVIVNALYMPLSLMMNL